MLNICGRKVKVVTGKKSQTVNICTSDNFNGVYDYIVRLRPPFIRENTLCDKEFATIDELVRYLQGDHSGQIEKTPVNGSSPFSGLDIVKGGTAVIGSIILKNLRNGRKPGLGLRGKPDVVCFAYSPDGKYLVYNLQKYNPSIYEIILHNILENKEEWRYKYPQDQVILELVFKGPRILAYSSPRGRGGSFRYSFTIDLTGKLVENVVESKKQKERDDTQDKIGQIFALNLADVAPTIKILVSARNQVDLRAQESAWISIMDGRHPLPAVYAMINDLAFVHIEIFARTPEERVSTVEKCLGTLTKKKKEFRRIGILIDDELEAEDVPTFPGSGPYFRSSIFVFVTAG